MTGPGRAIIITADAGVLADHQASVQTGTRNLAVHSRVLKWLRRAAGVLGIFYPLAMCVIALEKVFWDNYHVVIP